MQHGRHKAVEYPQVQSMTKPIPHEDSSPYPVCPKRKREPSVDDSDEPPFDESDVEYERKPMLFTQADTSFTFSNEPMALFYTRIHCSLFAGFNIES